MEKVTEKNDNELLWQLYADEIRELSEKIARCKARKEIVEKGIETIVKENFDFFKEESSSICEFLQEINSDIRYYERKLKEANEKTIRANGAWLSNAATVYSTASQLATTKLTNEKLNKCIKDAVQTISERIEKEEKAE